MTFAGDRSKGDLSYRPVKSRKALRSGRGAATPANTQLPLEPTEHINPRTIVELMPGIDAVCEGGRNHDCRWPWCGCFARDRNNEQEDQ